MQISVFLAFGYGLASIVSPCILPLLPVYLASLVGPEDFEDKAKRKRLPVFLHSLSFVIGFSIIFVLWGAGSGLAGAALISHLALLKRVSGVLLILFGLTMLAALRIPWLNFEGRLRLPVKGGASYWRSFLAGAVFPVAWIPCTSWVLGGILVLAGASQTAWRGAYLLAVYSLGLRLPFLALGAAFDLVSPWLKNIRRYSNWMYLVSGLLLIFVGALSLAGRLGLFTGQI